MTTRQTATIRAALHVWQLRNLPHPGLTEFAPLEFGRADIIACEHGPALDAEEVEALIELLTNPAPVAFKVRVIAESDGEQLVAVHSSVPLNVAALDWHLSDTSLTDAQIDKRNALDTEARGLPFSVRF